MSLADLPDSLRTWLTTHEPSSEVLGWTVHPMAGGAVAYRVERCDVVLGHPERGRRILALVRKWGPENETAGLRAAQEVREPGTVIPELIADGEDRHGPWMITPWVPGRPLTGDGVPDQLVVCLARLHAHFLGVPVDGVPRVDGQWWQSMIESWALPTVRTQVGQHPEGPPDDLVADVVDLLTTAATDLRAMALLEALPPTLLHGDVHPGNLLVDSDRVTLIDWGSSRRGPAMLDLANLMPEDSPQLRLYQHEWEQTSGRPLAEPTVALGYRWARLQIPIQYLPWTLTHRPADVVRGQVAEAWRALADLEQGDFPDW